MLRNVFFGSIGWGVRWSSLSDHTLFAYPRLDFGKVTLQPALLSSGGNVEKDTLSSEDLAPAVSMVLGYESPESWSTRLRGRLVATTLGNQNLSIYSGEAFVGFQTPRFLRGVYSVVGAHHGELFLGGMLQSFQIRTNPSTNFAVFGYLFSGGYRWYWR
jgi:hypothetical protein